MAPGQLVGPVGGDQQQWKGGQVPGKIAEQVEATRIGPVQVLQHRNHGASRGDGGEEVVNLAEEGRLAAGLGDAGIGQGGGKRRNPVARREAGQQLAPGTVGRGRAEVVATADQEGGAVTRPPRP